MLIEKKVVFQEPIQKVWDKIMDMESVIKCMPGVKSLKKHDGNSYSVEMAQKVGFIPVQLKLELKITSLEAPSHVETSADGTAYKGLGKAFQKQSLDLNALSENETELVYKGDLTLSGRIGTFGHRVLGGKIDSVSNDFLKNFVEKSGLKLKES